MGIADKIMNSEIEGGESKVDTSNRQHPSRNLPSRAKGYGVAAGYEKPYRPKGEKPASVKPDQYGPIPHSGYYGAGDSARPFKRGQASYSEELLWYPAQYGEKTSGFEPSK